MLLALPVRLLVLVVQFLTITMGLPNAERDRNTMRPLLVSSSLYLICLKIGATTSAIDNIQLAINHRIPISASISSSHSQSLLLHPSSPILTQDPRD